jgi:DNA processing protein
MSNTKYWLGFNTVKGIGSNRLRGLWSYFQQDMAAAWHADPDDLRRVGLDEKVVQQFLHHRQQFDLDAALKQLQHLNAWVCTIDDAAYPSLLAKIDDAPPLLYVKGDLLPQDALALAMVGTRRATTYGKKVAERIAVAMASAGITVISGLARGLDAVAHHACLRSGGRTIAVLGNGIDTVYPSEHKPLAEQIIRQGQGALITEYPPGTPPHGQHFPARNRIISGLALGVLVVEAPASSGALLTAGLAAEQGREVFAVPGNISSPNSIGTNRLIQDGAKLVLTPDDILNELNIQYQNVQTRQTVEAIAPATDLERDLLSLIDLEPLHVDDIAIQSGMAVSEVSAALLMMKLKGLVDETSPMMYMAAQSFS